DAVWPPDADRARRDREQPARHVRLQSGARSAAHSASPDLLVRLPAYYWRAVTLSCVFTITATARARAQDFVSPLVAIDFGSNSACVNVVLCADRHVAAGAAAGRLGDRLGFEEEVVYANDFFGNAPNLSSSILTVMTNGVLVRKVGAWRVYGVGGLGLM